MTAVLAAGLAVSQNRHFCVVAIGRSTHAFYQYFQALSAEPLNPMERLMFSLALTRAKVHRESRQTDTKPATAPALLLPTLLR